QQQDHIDSIVNDFDEHLNLDQSSPVENTKPHDIVQPPLPLPRKLLTPLSSAASDDECSRPPCPMPRTLISQHEVHMISQPISSDQQSTVHSIPSSEPLIDFNTERISPWSRFNNHRYSRDELESHVVYHAKILR
ncbi:unnamed protein product, partial [Rotaria magnacalcarata]